MSVFKEIKSEPGTTVPSRLIENSNLYGSCPSIPTLAAYEQNGNGLLHSPYDSMKPRSFLKSAPKFRPLSLSSSFNGTPQMSLADTTHFNQHRLSRSQNFASYKLSSSSNTTANQSTHNLLISALSSIQGFTEEHQHKLLSIERDSKKMAVDVIHSHNPADYTTMCLN